MFYGRKRELAVLEETYRKKGFQMTVVYGRRRIGKSTLIAEFIKDKRSSYYTAAKTSFADNIRKWSAQLIEDIVPDAAGAVFEDADSFFDFMGKNCGGERTVIVLDELPYLAETDLSFLSVFQRAIDNVLSKSNIYLILCGSAISFMENEVLAEKSPLFGRRTNQIFLKPFDYIESALFVPKYSCEQKAIVYGVTGGVAKYLSLFDDDISLDENLIKLFFSPSGYLYDEAANLLTQEFRSTSTYNLVIEVCASGTNRANEIADKAHITTSALSFILKSLMTVGIVSRISPITDKHNKKKNRYEVTDGMYRFWYKFIPPAVSAIEQGRGEVFYMKNVKPRLHEYMGSVFEKMCRDYTLMAGIDGRLDTMVTEIGSWWGSGRDHRPTDIDVVGIDNINHTAVIGECKFKNEKLDKDIYDTLLSRAGLIEGGYSENEYLLFSLSGFSKWVSEEADKKVKMISIDDMYQLA